MTSFPPSKDAGTCDDHIMNDSKNTLAAHPSAVSVLDLTIIQYCSFVKLNASPVYGSGERNLVRMEVLPA